MADIIPYLNRGINFNDQKRLDELFIGVTALSGYVDFGTYSPTLSGLVNIAAVSGFVNTYAKNGSICTVAGSFEMIATTGSVDGTATSLMITLPIPSALTLAYDVNGTAVTTRNTGASAKISAQTGHDRALVSWNEIAANNAVQSVYNYVFQYLIK